MTFQAFTQSLNDTQPPPNLSLALEALWYDGQGNWEQSHQLIQDEPGTEAALIHAYLHRKEGDTWNADYWYRRAGRTRPALSLQAEWEALVQELLP
ncbi:hypothetical protein SAMN05444008_11671 [Cnuella takakiae]|uniref:Uncharacterized protein n=1 Tax=Cnuella takakiae TaxID=1302690 RepID=A0A1M5GGQ8_9BACT|nr:hypothetical protein [Cnuella takakiae]OLY92414.1 hypothetical protein BUE76_11320 [Cnuella takakiae]SHG02878.1 hypothetical protein SAMN05444008_11671 [Cnuella takakiae]